MLEVLTKWPIDQYDQNMVKVQTHFGRYIGQVPGAYIIVVNATMTCPYYAHVLEVLEQYFDMSF